MIISNVWIIHNYLDLIIKIPIPWTKCFLCLL